MDNGSNPLLPKNGILGYLAENNPKIIFLSSGGTYELLKSRGFTVVDFEEYTCAPQMKDGLVKSIDYKIHSSVLAQDFNNVKGRVLKRKPKKKFSGLEDATEIGNEKKFKLEKGQKLLVVGTYYNRKDADWFDFTKGREYEKKGHYHARMLQGCSDFQHEVFHLRELSIPKNTVVPFIITPISQIIKITPVEEKDGVYFCSVTGKSLNTLIEEFNGKI